MRGILGRPAPTGTPVRDRPTGTAHLAPVSDQELLRRLWTPRYRDEAKRRNLL